MTPQVQVAVFSGGGQVNLWLAHQKYISRGAYGDPRKKAFFYHCGGFASKACVSQGASGGLSGGGKAPIAVGITEPSPLPDFRETA